MCLEWVPPQGCRGCHIVHLMPQLSGLCMSKFATLAAVAVLGVSIAVPLALQPGRDSVLSCTVSAAGGGLQVRSAAAAAPHLDQLHLTAHAGQSWFHV